MHEKISIIEIKKLLPLIKHPKRTQHDFANNQKTSIKSNSDKKR